MDAHAEKNRNVCREGQKGSDGWQSDLMCPVDAVIIYSFQTTRNGNFKVLHRESEKLRPPRRLNAVYYIQRQSIDDRTVCTRQMLIAPGFTIEYARSTSIAVDKSLPHYKRQYLYPTTGAYNINPTNQFHQPSRLPARCRYSSHWEGAISTCPHAEFAFSPPHCQCPCKESQHISNSSLLTRQSQKRTKHTHL